jgi:hypothetical protein
VIETHLAGRLCEDSHPMLTVWSVLVVVMTAALAAFRWSVLLVCSMIPTGIVRSRDVPLGPRARACVGRQIRAP